MTAPDNSAVAGGCPFCSSQFQAVFHGGACPKVKAIEYHPSGGIKRVEFHDEKPVVGSTPGRWPWSI